MYACSQNRKSYFMFDVQILFAQTQTEKQNHNYFDNKSEFKTIKNWPDTQKQKYL